MATNATSTITHNAPPLSIMLNFVADIRYSPAPSTRDCGLRCIRLCSPALTVVPAAFPGEVGPVRPQDMRPHKEEWSIPRFVRIGECSRQGSEFGV
jgi:hypothetical protein